MKKLLLNKSKTGIVIIDVQKKLMDVIARKKGIISNINRLILLADIYSLPVVVTEQYPRWLGPTIPEISDTIPSYEPIEKMFFNCCKEDAFTICIKKQNSDTIILTGVETHICVFQTCLTLLEKGYSVHVPHDAVGSRNDENMKIGLGLMKEAGAVITTTETIIYQVLEKAGTKEFKQMMKALR